MTATTATKAATATTATTTATTATAATTDNDEQAAMRLRVKRLVYIAAGGRIKEEDLGSSDTDLRTIGLDSLSYLNLLEGLERTFGVAIDLDQEEDHSFLHTIDNIVRYLGRRSTAA
ncbi:MAG: acyl carrier protein [Acidobacteria bacterium]|nr:acyl carrier protein [Acidobacteriota bacterium]